jgi:hypothetical protein
MGLTIISFTEPVILKREKNVSSQSLLAKNNLLSITVMNIPISGIDDFGRITLNSEILPIDSFQFTQSYVSLDFLA